MKKLAATVTVASAVILGMGVAMWSGSQPDHGEAASAAPSSKEARAKAERALARASLTLPEAPFEARPVRPHGRLQYPIINYDRVQVPGRLDDEQSSGIAPELVAKYQHVRKPDDPRAIAAMREEKQLRRAQKHERRRRRDELGDYSRPAYKMRPGPGQVREQVQRSIEAAEAGQ